MPLGESAQVTLEYEHKDASFNGNYSIFPLVHASSGQFVPLFVDPSLNFGERSMMREQTDVGGLLWSVRVSPGRTVKQQLFANLVHSTAPQVTTFGGIGPSEPTILRVLRRCTASWCRSTLPMRHTRAALI